VLKFLYCKSVHNFFNVNEYLFIFPGRKSSINFCHFSISAGNIIELLTTENGCTSSEIIHSTPSSTFDRAGKISVVGFALVLYVLLCYDPKHALQLFIF